jgi:hypothetical protein
MFLGAVSGGLVALGLIATAAGVHTAFYAFALILLPTLVFVGWRPSTGRCSQGSRTSATQAGSRGCATTTFSTLPNWPATCSASRRRSGCACRDRGWALAEVPDGRRDGRARHRRAGRLGGWAAGSRRL